MADKRRKGPTPRRKRWQPMRRGTPNPALLARLQAIGEPESVVGYEAWGNDIFQAVVRLLDNGAKHISLKRHDRGVVRDWRQLQSIKNEIAGAESWAVEIFPPESVLMDTANEYHLWVYPPGEEPPFGYKSGIALATPELVEEMNEADERRRGERGRGRQEPWQEGLSTGVSRMGPLERTLTFGELRGALKERDVL